MKRIGIQLPTRSRPDRLKVLYDSWVLQTEGNSELVVGIDEDEKELYGWVFKCPEIKVIITPQEDYVAKANFMIKQMQGYEYIYLLADDFVINSKFESTFLAEAVPYCVFYGRDSYMNSKLPTAPFMDNEIFRRLGYIAPPTLIHYFADNIWAEWGKAMGTYRYFDNVNIQHLHVSKYGQYADKVYDQSNKFFQDDWKAFDKYVAEQLPLDISKLQA